MIESTTFVYRENDFLEPHANVAHGGVPTSSR